MSNKKKLNSIDWLVEELRKYIEEPWKYVPKGGKEAIIKQAKAMHEEEHKNTFIEGTQFSMYQLDIMNGLEIEWDPKPKNFQDYYNETFGGEQ